MSDEEKTLPDYITENPDGSVSVALRGRDPVTMREPLISDQLATKGTNEQREIALIGNLTGLTPDEVTGLTMRDYRRLQAAFVGFQE